jgi:sulfide:quinone oxidoreductase
MALSQIRPRTRNRVAIVGGGAGGIAAAASMLKRRRDLDITLIEPSDTHCYPPGWTMVGGGIFDSAPTRRPMAAVVPKGIRWLRIAAAGFRPDDNVVLLEDGASVPYDVLVVAPGIVLDWDAVDGLSATLGRNGVTSNYRFDLAPYTWELVQGLGEGEAVFTQPPMPIKCAGAPQKAMYLSCDHWRRSGRLGRIEVAFHSAAGVLFGVKEYVPALMAYVERYGIGLRFNSNLIAVDGPARRATFSGPDGAVTRGFDLLHVSPPQKAPAFVADSALAAETGYVAVDPATLAHVHYGNVFGLGDACSAPNAKTAAAARKQAPVVAVNALAALRGAGPGAVYDGYGSCPLTVERGRIVLAEFGYDGRLLPTFPKWLIEGTRPAVLPWLLKERVLPRVYWDAMLKGREWLARPATPPPLAPDRGREADRR